MTYQSFWQQPFAPEDIFEMGELMIEPAQSCHKKCWEICLVFS